MHGYQIRTLIEKMYLIQRLIVEQNWDELKKTCKIACEVEEILYEINPVSYTHLRAHET